MLMNKYILQRSESSNISTASIIACSKRAGIPGGGTGSVCSAGRSSLSNTSVTGTAMDTVHQQYCIENSN